MIHLKLNGTHTEIGNQLGHFFKGSSHFPIRLSKNQLRHGTNSLLLLEKHFREATDEIKGIVAEVGMDYELFGAWLMCMGCCLTFRENHNVEVRGCTAFSFVDNGKVIYGRNNDLPPYLKDVSKSIRYQVRGKVDFLMNTSSFTNGEEGINSHGLVAAMTFVIPKSGEVLPGINSIFLVRYILEHCKNVQEGVDALHRLPIASSCNILLADKSGSMLVVECNPFKVNIRYPERDDRGESYVATVNHFSSTEMQVHDRSRQNVYSSKARYETACNALKKCDYTDATTHTKAILSGKLGFMCQYKKVKFETIWSTIFNISEAEMHLAEGNPEHTSYTTTKLLED